MYTKTLKHLTVVREELEDLLEVHAEKMLDTKNLDLQDDIEKNIIDALNDTVEQIDIIIENIENASYESNDELDYDN